MEAVSHFISLNYIILANFVSMDGICFRNHSNLILLLAAITEF